MDEFLNLTEMPLVIMQYKVSKLYHIFITYRAVLGPNRDAIVDDATNDEQIISHIYHI